MPVVVLSGPGRRADGRPAVHEGAQDYLVKGTADAPPAAARSATPSSASRAELELARQALYDPLTGLANRTLFTERLSWRWPAPTGTTARCAVMFLDLDRFKAVNDGLGHDVGDGLLKVVAACWRWFARGHGHPVRRRRVPGPLRGHRGLSRHAPGCRAAQRRAGRPFASTPTPIHVGASIGVALAGDRHQPRALIREADHAMYEAKHARSRYRAGRGPARSAPPPAAVGSDLHLAIERDQLRLYYQPEVDLARMKIFGVEALAALAASRTRRDRACGLPARRRRHRPDPFLRRVGALPRPAGSSLMAAGGGVQPGALVGVNLSLRQLCDGGLVTLWGRRSGRPASRAARSVSRSPRPRLRPTRAAADQLAAQAARGLAQPRRLRHGRLVPEVLDRYPVDMLKIDRSLVHRLRDGLRPRRHFVSMVSWPTRSASTWSPRGSRRRTSSTRYPALGATPPRASTSGGQAWPN